MYQITEWCHHFIREQVRPGSFCIDATMGNGGDTELLCRLAGPEGRVLAFDIQKSALSRTEKRLRDAGVPDNFRLILDSHSHMTQYADAGTIDCIVFNLGYLPGGDHRLATKPASTLRALEQSLPLLKRAAWSACASTAGEIRGLKNGTQSWPGLRNWIPENILWYFLPIITGLTTRRFL